MLDPKSWRQDAVNLAQRLGTRGYCLEVEEICALENQRKTLQKEIQTLQSQANRYAKEIGLARGEVSSAQALLPKVQAIKTHRVELEQTFEAIRERLESLVLAMPNLPDPSVPVGKDEGANAVIRHYGHPRTFPFSPKDHVELGKMTGGMAFEVASRMARSRFVILEGALARLQRALIHFMLEVHTQEHGYREVYVPYVVNQRSLRGTGQLPKCAEELFALAEDPPLYLIPTAEVPMSNMAYDRLFDVTELPKKYVCHSPCFRREAGSYGRDTRGMIRQHQFEKVELVQLVLPDCSDQALEDMTRAAEVILQKLELPYRVVALCTGDLGFSAAKTYDLEVWLPSQTTYREISSCSNCTDFQARRLKARWRNPKTSKPEFLHTLNGSALAVGRTLVALMENYQTEAGGIEIPTALQPYLGGQQVIFPA